MSLMNALLGHLIGGLFSPETSPTHKTRIYYAKQKWGSQFQQNTVSDKYFSYVQRQLPNTCGILVGSRGSAKTWNQGVQVIVSE